MDGNRIINLMVLELTSDKLKLEEELEWVVNSDTISIDKKVIRIKQVLKNIALNESTTLIWARQTSELNNENLKVEENGEKS